MEKLPKQPLFITFEGGEGAGKTTLIKRVAEFLQSRNYQVVTTREPGGSMLGEQIRQILLNENSFSIGNKAELFLFLAARAQHLDELISPQLTMVSSCCVIDLMTQLSFIKAMQGV